MQPLKLAALNIGVEFHELDHTAPLSYFLNMPVITTEKRTYEIAQKYYPQITTLYDPDAEEDLSKLSNQFDVIFGCKYWKPHLKWLFETFHDKSMQLILCPHGQSDKGFKEPTLASYAWQDGILLYGDLMVEMLKTLKVFSSNQKRAVVGNYRYLFYQKQKSFYQDLVQKELILSESGPTLLYAPTWQDADQNTSFFTQAQKVIEELPSNWNLIIKPHPLLKERDPGKYYPIMQLIKDKKNISLLNTPFIYPIFPFVDLYLGDASSVGYDFLSFQKPMYFFPIRGGCRLHSCGKTLHLNQNLYSQMSLENTFQKEQQALYKMAFAPCTEESLINSIHKMLNASFAIN